MSAARFAASVSDGNHPRAFRYTRADEAEQAARKLFLRDGTACIWVQRENATIALAAYIVTDALGRTWTELTLEGAAYL